MPSDNQPKTSVAAIQSRRLSFRLVGLEPASFVAVSPAALTESQERHLAGPSRGIPASKKPRIDADWLASRIPLPRPALPREKITGPLSPLPDPTDETLFEDASEPKTKFYLPRYRVAEQTVSGKAQFRIKLEQHVQGGTLTIFLERFPAPKLQATARQASELPHSIAVKLVARIPMGSSQIQQEFVFQEIIKEGLLLKAVLRLEQLAQLTQVYQILTEASFAASLIVLRSARVAVPVPPNNSVEIQQLTAQIQKLQQEINDLSKQVTALEARKRQLERLAPTNPAARRMLQTLQIQLNKLNAQRTGKATELRQKRLQLASMQKQKLFRVVLRVMDWAVAPSPFVFAKDLHRYIFGNVLPPESGKLGFVRRQVMWGQRSHTYYQESLEAHRFHFLPDSFKVARRPETPHYPMLAVRFPNPDAAEETMPVTLEYVSEPYFDSERLQAAAEELKRKLPELAGSDREIEFEPLLCDTTHLFLTLPRGEAGPQREERKTATINLRTGILDAITLPMRDFQGLFDALFGDSAVVFQGEVVIEIDAGQNIPTEKVPVICRLADLVGDIFDVDFQQDPVSNGVRATLRNAIESPTEIRSLKAILTRGGTEADGVIAGLSFEAPVGVRPGEALNCQVTPATALGGSGDVAVLFDFDQVVVKPDSEAVWATVVDQTRLPEFTRTIKVKTIKQTFEPKPDQPSDPVVAAVVDFERGDTIELNADRLEANAKVRLSLADYVLRRLDTGQYRYAVTVIRASGQIRNSEWRTDRVGILFPQIN
jgi:hypothetical protein